MIKKILSIIFILFYSFCWPFIPAANGEAYYCNTFNGVGDNPESHVEEVVFDTYDLVECHLDLLFPSYTSAVGSDSCAPTAGSMVVAYYDVNYTNLIPNYEPGYYRGRYRFYGLNDTIIGVMQQLYNLMGTNTEARGTSFNQFKNGLKQYFNNSGYNISYNSFGNLSEATAIEQINLQKPVVLFLSSYDYYPIIGVTIEDNSITMVGYRKKVGHVVVAYGYQEFRYYKNNTLFKTDKFLIVSFGDDTYGYLALNNDTIINESISININ